MQKFQVHIFEVCVFLGEFILGGCFPGTYISGAYVTCVNASPTSKYYRWSVEYTLVPQECTAHNGQHKRISGVDLSGVHLLGRCPKVHARARVPRRWMGKGDTMGPPWVHTAYRSICQTHLWTICSLHHKPASRLSIATHLGHRVAYMGSKVL